MCKTLNIKWHILHKVTVIGYEPSGLTVQPPPSLRMIEGGLIFFAWVSSVTNICS